MNHGDDGCREIPWSGRGDASAVDEPARRPTSEGRGIPPATPSEMGSGPPAASAGRPRASRCGRDRRGGRGGGCAWWAGSASATEATGKAAEDVASVEVSARTAAGDVVADEAAGAEGERDPPREVAVDVAAGHP